MTIDEIQKNLIGEKKVPPVKAGDVVRIVQEFEEEGGAKQQIFEGVVIATRGEGLSKTFTVRKVTAGVGVEKIYPLYSPTIKKIQIKKSSKVKRAKLYWLRDRFGRKARLEEKDLDPEVIKLMAAEEKVEEAKKVDQAEEVKKAGKDKKEEAKEEKKRSGAKSSGLSAEVRLGRTKVEAKSEGGNKDENKEKEEKFKAEPKKAPSDSKDKS